MFAVMRVHDRYHLEDDRHRPADDWDAVRREAHPPQVCRNCQRPPADHGKSDARIWQADGGFRLVNPVILPDVFFDIFCCAGQ